MRVHELTGIAFHLICTIAGLAMLGLAADCGRSSVLDRYRRIPIAAGLVVMGRVVGLLILSLGVQQLAGFQEWVLETLALAALFWAFLYGDFDSRRRASVFLVVASLLLAVLFAVSLLTVILVSAKSWSVILWLATLILCSSIVVHLLQNRLHSSPWLRAAFISLSLAAVAGLLGNPSVAALVHSAALTLFVLEIGQAAPRFRAGRKHSINEAQDPSRSLVEHTAFLLEVSRAFSSSLSLPVVLERVSESAARAVAADWVYVLLPEGGNAERLIIAARFGWWGQRWKTESESRRQISVDLRNFSLLRHSFVRQRQVLANQPEDYEPFIRLHDRLSRPPPGPILIQPLSMGERSLGTLVLGRVDRAPQKNGSGSAAFGESDAGLCRALAAQAAAAISNAQTYEGVSQEALKLADGLERGHDQLGQYQAVLESFADGVLVLGPARELRALNRAAKEILGAQDEPWLAGEAERLFGRLLDSIGRQNNSPVTVRWKGKQITGTLTPLKTPEGAFLGWAAVVRDVGQERHIEAVVQRQIRRIAQQILASMASLTGHADLLALEIDRDGIHARRRSVAALRADSESMAGLVEDLLFVVETQSATVELAPELVDVSREIEAAVRMARSSAEDKHQRMVYEISPNLGLVYADPHRLRQIVGKLLASAVYHAPEGAAIQLEASSALLQDASGLLRKHLVVRVHDPGAYAPSDESAEDFHAFHRVTNLASPKAGRTALGLIGARRLVDAHGGSIWAESGSVGGCILSFTIPAREPA